MPNYCECIGINLDKSIKKLGWSFIIADARFLPFMDNKIDYAISNSVIEHVEYDSAIFSKELKRIVSKGFFISCPYYFTPIEPHYFVPFFQFVPEKVKRFLVLKLGLKIGHISRKDYEIIELSSLSRLKKLFPKASITIFTLFGIPLDVVIVGKKE